MADRKIIKAPWTDEQVKVLNEYQDNPLVHPFTCRSGNRKDDEHKDGEGLLVATPAGWICPFCSYKQQDWAHRSMFGAIPPPLTPEQLKEKLQNLEPEQITFAESMEIERRKEQVDALMRILGKIMGWEGEELDHFVDTCFNSDMSSIGDFLYAIDDDKIVDSPTEVQQLSKELGFSVTRSDLIFEVAMRMKKAS